MLTTRDVQDRLLTLKLGHLATSNHSQGLTTFVSDKVTIGRDARGFLIYVHEQNLVEIVRAAFADASGQITVRNPLRKESDK